MQDSETAEYGIPWWGKRGEIIENRQSRKEWQTEGLYFNNERGSQKIV